jgi:hypothetical protein
MSKVTRPEHNVRGNYGTGAFSVSSLAVTDIEASKLVYEKLGFTVSQESNPGVG